MMEWVMLPLVESGIKEFVIAASYLSEQITNYFSKGERWGVSIKYSFGPKPAGKAGEIWRARSSLGSEAFLVVPGDTICHLDYRALRSFHQGHGGTVTVACSTRYQLEVGIAEVDNQNCIRKFDEKPNLGQPVSTGAYVLDQRIFRFIEAFDPDKGEVDLPADVFPRMLEEGEILRAFVRDYPWWDIGKVSDYEYLVQLPGGEALKILRPGYNL